jgi:glycogen synthase
MNESAEPNEMIVTKLRRELNVPKESQVFGTISRLVPQKDLKTQLLAFDDYLKFNQNGVLLLLVGRRRIS